MFHQNVIPNLFRNLSEIQETLNQVQGDDGMKQKRRFKNRLFFILFF